MRAIVTRPAAEAGAWVESLRAEGIDAWALPLIAIGPAPDPSRVEREWQSSLAGRGLVVFVSPNAVRGFFAHRPAAAGWPATAIAAAPGPGTADALRAHGVDAARIVEPAAAAASFDSESLWAELRHRDWRGASTLVVRGVGGREWLGGQLEAAGATVASLAAYTRGRPAFDAAATRIVAEAVAAPRRAVWLFSSSQAIANLIESTDRSRWRQSRAIASHPRIAERTRDAGFAEVIACRPHRAAVIACIQSMRP